MFCHVSKKMAEIKVLFDTRSMLDNYILLLNKRINNNIE